MDEEIVVEGTIAGEGFDNVDTFNTEFPIYELWSEGSAYQWMVHYPETEVFVAATNYNEPVEIMGKVYTPVNGSFEVDNG